MCSLNVQPVNAFRIIQLTEQILLVIFREFVSLLLGEASRVTFIEISQLLVVKWNLQRCEKYSQSIRLKWAAELKL